MIHLGLGIKFQGQSNWFSAIQIEKASQLEGWKSGWLQTSPQQCTNPESSTAIATIS